MWISEPTSLNYNIYFTWSWNKGLSLFSETVYCTRNLHKI